MCNQPGVQVTLKDGPFNGRQLFKTDGSFKEGTELHFDGFSYRIEWDNLEWEWVAYCVDNNSI